MNTQITEDYVSFEIAKLLKEKGFDEQCAKFAYKIGNRIKYAIDKDCPCNSDLKYIYREARSLPTLQMAMKWLREIHKIDVWVECHSSNRRYKGYIHSEQRGDEALFYENSYEKACEAAIKHCLENLI